MNDSANAFRAGIVIVVAVGIGIAFFMAAKKSELNTTNSIAHYAYLTDATGVNAKSLITVAGLQVGEVKNITLTTVTLAELVPDLEVRALDVLGFAPPTADVRIPKNEDFDAVIQTLIDQRELPSRDDVRDRQLSREDVLAQIAAVKNQPVRVARLDFNVTDDVPVPIDSWMKKESLGVLGAKALFLELGPSQEMIPPGGRLTNVRSMTGTDALLVQAQAIVADVQGITNKLDRDIGGITGDIRGITGELHRFISGDGDTKPLGELYTLVMTDLRALSRTVESAVRDANDLMNTNDGQITQLLANVQSITSDIADLTAAGTGAPGADGEPEGEGDLRATMGSVRKVADDLSQVTAQLRDVLGDNEEEVGEGIKSLQETIRELNRSLASLSEVAGRVERGEGTVGRLLTDEKMADKVESAVSGASDFVASLTSLETHVDIGTWYNVNRGGGTTVVGLRLQPKPDKFYLVEVVNDDGRLERVTERDRDGNFIRESIREADNQLRFSAMFAKRFFDFLVLRVGLIETSGGVGANLFGFDDRIELRTDLFNIGMPRDSTAFDSLPSFYLPRWRTMLKAQPIPHIYVSAGIDDALNGFGPNGFQPYDRNLGYGFDYFFGVGLTFKDDDLRAILPFVPGG